MLFTNYMNKSLSFRQILTNHCSQTMEANESRQHIYLLDKIDNKAEIDKSFRIRFFNWLINKSSTIQLRNICKEVDCDYWENILNSNIIDTFDSLQFKL